MQCPGSGNHRWGGASSWRRVTRQTSRTQLPRPRPIRTAQEGEVLIQTIRHARQVAAVIAGTAAVVLLDRMSASRLWWLRRRGHCRHRFLLSAQPGRCAYGLVLDWIWLPVSQRSRRLGRVSGTYSAMVTMGEYARGDSWSVKLKLKLDVRMSDADGLRR